MGLFSWVKRNAGGIVGGALGLVLGGPAGAAIGSGLGSKTVDDKSWKNALVASGVGGVAGLGLNAVNAIPSIVSKGGAAAGTGSVAASSPQLTGGASMLESTAPSFLSKMSQYSPYLFAGSQVLNAVNQAGMAEDMNAAQEKSYQDYLSLINPPEEVKQARYNTLRNQVSTTGTDARRRLRDTLASRGIRGRGIGGPNANLERTIMDANNDAFNQIYGTYNVPGEAPPVNYAPSTANILGKNISDIGTLLMMQNLYNNA